MKKPQKSDRIIKFASYTILFLTIGILILSLPTFVINLQNPTLEKSSNITLNQCGYTRKDVIILFDNSIFHDRFFIFPYSGVKINARDYFSLKERQPSKPSIMEAGNQSYYYSLILQQFQKKKKSYNLDDDQYLELIVYSVQSIPYYTDYSKIKYPLITFTDGCGDCDDKSLLLFALLSREGYNVSVIRIPPRIIGEYGHEMIGIASSSYPFTKNGYALIETTSKKTTIGTFPAYMTNEKIQVLTGVNGTKTYETNTSTWISDEGMFRIKKNTNKTISITPYDYNLEFFDFFKDPKEENFDWKKDCENKQIPEYICKSINN